MRIAFIGGHGHHYLAQLVERGEAEAVGFAPDEHDAEAAKAWAARRVPAAPWYDDARTMLDEVRPDVVSVGAMYAYNGDWVIEAVDRHLPVVSDKPIAASWDQYNRLAGAVESHPSAVILTEFDLRARACFRAARLAVADGRIGTPVLATAQKSYRFGKARPDFYKSRADYGGTLLWVASHGIDTVWYVSGCDFASVSGHHGNVAKPDYREFEDHVAVCYALGNGGSAMVHADFLRPAAAPTHGDDRVRVVGSEGQVEVRGDVCTLITQTDGPSDITAEGQSADMGSDLAAALAGETSIFSTANSIYMAQVLLKSRDACDQGRLIQF